MALIRALDQDDYEEVGRILEDNPEEVRIKDEEDRVALHYAASANDLNSMKLVYVADRSLVDLSDKEGHTPLLCALMQGRVEHAEFLSKNGANVHHVDKNGRNAIHWTVVCAQLEALNWAIGKDVNVNLKDNSQQCTPLHYATCNEDVSSELGQAILITLLRHGADTNSRDADYRTPILWCSSSGNIDALMALYNSGGDLSVKDKDHLSVLHCAASHGYHEIIEFCISRVNKTMVDESDRAGHTALFYAISFGHYESALKLLQNDADPNHQDQRLRTPSHNAAAKGQMRMLKLLKQFNASFDIQNYRGDVPFHEAVQSGSKDVVEWLLAIDGSVLDIPNHNGRTALHLAATAGNIEMVILLCGKKCFVDPLMTLQNDVYTPLDLAVLQKHDVVVEYLTKLCGAKSKNEFSAEKIENWKVAFASMIAEAKKKRNQMISDRKRKDRRPSTTDGVVESEKKVKEIAEVGVNTTQRNTRSADAEKRKHSKSTSVTNLMQVPSPPKAELEALKASIENGKQLVDDDDDDHDEMLDIDEEFENLPPISDLSETSTSSEDDSEEEEEKSEDEEGVEKKISVQEAKESPEKSKKPSRVRIESQKGSRQKKRSSDEKQGTVVMRVRREPEVGSDGGDVDIYDDGEGKASDDETEKSKSSATTNRRFIHEKAIFQELTHLKRMQIQYGKVQEKVLVRSLISNFCKMHNLDVRNFKFQTFYAWEKFLYDALSEQLKIIYLEERERITETNSDMKSTNGAMKLNKFDSKIRNSVPITEKLRDMQRIYSHNTVSQKSSRSKTQPKESSRKRCDCLDKHLFL